MKRKQVIGIQQINSFFKLSKSKNNKVNNNNDGNNNTNNNNKPVSIAKCTH